MSPKMDVGDDVITKRWLYKLPTDVINLEDHGTYTPHGGWPWSLWPMGTSDGFWNLAGYEDYPKHQVQIGK